MHRIGVTLFAGIAALVVWSGDPQSEARVPQEKVEKQLMDRWNAALGGVNTEGFDFHWNDFNKFPHPTYKGGSEKAYGAFTRALVAFYKHKDNFDYLAKNRLFMTELRYTFDSGQVSKFGTLAQLTAQMATPKAIGSKVAGEDTHKALQEYAERSQMLSK